MGQADDDDIQTLTGQKENPVGKIQGRGTAKEEAEKHADPWSAALNNAECHLTGDSFQTTRRRRTSTPSTTFVGLHDFPASPTPRIIVA
jgi:hypothetical protein